MATDTGLSASQSSPEPVVIPSGEFDAIRTHAESEYPRITCGVIITRGTELRVLPCRNIQDDLHAENPKEHPRDARTDFFVAPDDLIRIWRLQSEGFSLSVIYHSNTDARAYLSSTDRRSALSDSGSPLYPGTAYLVISVVKGRAEDSAAFRWDLQLRDFVGVPLQISQTGHEARAPQSPPPPARPLRVFLCHSSRDKELVRQLYRRLKCEMIDPWLDEEKLLPGQDWDQEIAKAVRASDVVLVCLSRASINRAGYVQREIKYALDVADQQPEGMIFLIPGKLEECEVPDRLRRWQWVELFEPQGYDLLLRALQARSQSLA